MDTRRDSEPLDLPPVARTLRERAGLAPEEAGDLIELDSVEAKTLDRRLDASRNAQERTRLAFFASTVIALALFTAGWNGYLSFYRDFASEFASLEGGEGTTILQKELLSEWVRGRMINIALLGIRVGVDDAPFVGAVALAIAGIWLLYSIRRENHLIGWLLRDYRFANDKFKWLVFSAINSATVFTNVTHGDAPFRTTTELPSPDEQLFLIRWAARHLWYLPILSLWFIIVLDFLSAFSFFPLSGNPTSGALSRPSRRNRNSGRNSPPVSVGATGRCSPPSSARIGQMR
jgi:hypothetical protein